MTKCIMESRLALRASTSFGTIRAEAGEEQPGDRDNYKATQDRAQTGIHNREFGRSFAKLIRNLAKLCKLCKFAIISCNLLRHELAEIFTCPRTACCYADCMALGKPNWRATAIVMGTCLSYAIIRCQIAGGVSWSHFPLWTTNKAIASAAW